MPLLGLILVLSAGLFLTQVLLVFPLELISWLKAPLWLMALGLFLLFAWFLGD